MRINVYIAYETGLSRRHVDRMIEEGRVKINGKRAALGQQVNLEKDRVLLDGRKIQKKEKPVTIALYKPRAYVTTRRDPMGRKTIMSLLPPDLQKLKPVGRLDFESEGLLLMSNNGDFIQHHTHPKYESKKVYRITLQTNVSNQLLSRLQKGVKLKEGIAKAQEIRKLGPKRIELVVHQGWNRQIRRMIDMCRNTVTRLVRTQVGDIYLEDLKPGEWRQIKT